MELLERSGTMAGLAIAVLCLLACWLPWLYRFARQRARRRELVKDFEGPKWYPIVGSALPFINKSPTEFFKHFNELTSRFRSPIKHWLGSSLAIYIGEPALVADVLTSSQWAEKSQDYRFLRPWLGQGLLTSSGSRWHARRMALTPTFHFTILHQFVDVFAARSASLVAALEKHADTGETVDIVPYVLLFALDVICETAMGTTVNALENSDSAYVRAVRTAAGAAMSRMFDLFMRSPLFYCTPTYFRQRAALRLLHDHTDRIIAARKEERRRQRSATSDDTVCGGKRRLVFLDLLLELTVDGQPLTDDEIRQEVNTFMFEGHDTTTSAISFALWCLAKHPDVQRRVRQECWDVLGDDLQRPATLGELQRLRYLQMVIKETLRLYPSVPLIARRNATELTVGGKTIPADSTVIVGVYQMGRDGRYFADPLEFRPERFGPDGDIERENVFRYVPFSAGPRNCIGQKYAMYEMKSVLSTMVRKYELVKPADVEEPLLGAELVLKPYPGVLLQLRSLAV